jgi:hypothetical protein
LYPDRIVARSVLSKKYRPRIRYMIKNKTYAVLVQYAGSIMSGKLAVVKRMINWYPVSPKVVKF